MKKKRIVESLLLTLLLLVPLSKAEDVITMPVLLQVIDQEAFLGSSSIHTVVLNDGITEIRSKAFANSSVTEINLPDSLTFIADDAFDKAYNVTVSVNMDSYAHEWAKDNLKGRNQHILSLELVTVNETIPMMTETIKSNYVSGDYVKEEGRDGTCEVTYKIEYKDGVEVSKSQVSSKVIVEMIPRVKVVSTWTTTYENITVDYNSSGATRDESVEAEAQAWALAMAKGEMKYGHTGQDRMESIVTRDNLEDIPDALKNHCDVSDAPADDGYTYGIGVVKVSMYDEDGNLMHIYYIGAGIGY